MSKVEGVIRSETTDGLRTLMLCRPRTKNSVDAAMAQALASEIAEAAETRSVRALLLTGAGATFSTGGDLEELTGFTPERFSQHMRMLHAMARQLQAFPRPVVVALDGVCAGGSCALALAGDAVIATPRTRFSFGFVKMGLVPDLGLAWLLARRVGPARAQRLLLEGSRVDGNQAVGMGLVDQLESPEQLRSVSEECARSLAAAPTEAWSRTKSLFVNLATTYGMALEQELELQQACFEGEEFGDQAEKFLSERRGA